MDKYVHNERRKLINTLKLFCNDIFSLLKFENILNPIDNSERVAGGQLTNITRVQPAVLVFCLVGKLLVLEVAYKDRRSTHADFTTRIRL